MTDAGAVSALARIIGPARYLLFDFDGPICSIFAGLSSGVIAEQLRELLADAGVEVPLSLRGVTDPLEILRFTGTAAPAMTGQVEAALRAAELAAVRHARPTPCAREVLLASRATNRGVALVSNNSEAAVEAYVAAHQVAHLVDQVVARTSPDPSLLKPHPHLILSAVDRLAAAPHRCVLVGDSVSDIEGAWAAGTKSLGLADKPGKYERLSFAGADAVIRSMTELHAALSRSVST